MEKPPRTADTASASIDHLLETVAARLKDARLTLGLTQREVAEKAGIRFSYVYEIETGKTNVTLRTLASLAGALGLDIRTLFPVTDSLVPSPTADDVLGGFLDKTHALLLEDQAKRAELLAELQSVLLLRKTVDTPELPMPVSKEPGGNPAGAKGRGGKRADRPGHSH